MALVLVVRGRLEGELGGVAQRLRMTRRCLRFAFSRDRAGDLQLVFFGERRDGGSGRGGLLLGLLTEEFSHR